MKQKRSDIQARLAEYEALKRTYDKNIAVYDNKIAELKKECGTRDKVLYYQSCREDLIIQCGQLNSYIVRYKEMLDDPNELED